MGGRQGSSAHQGNKRCYMRLCSRFVSCRVTTESSIEIQPSLRNWPRVRVTVSRVVQVIEAISSWVSSSGKRNSPLSVCSPNRVRKLNQQPCQPRSYCFGQRNAARVLQRKPVLLADALHGA